MTPKQMTESKQGAFSRAYLNGLVKALSAACGYSWLLSATMDAKEAEREEDAVRFLIKAAGSLNGEFVLELRRRDAITIASRMLREQENEYGEVESETLLELVKAAGEHFTPESGQGDGDVRFHASSIEEAPESACVFEGNITGEDGAKIAIAIHLSEALDAMFGHAEAEVEETELEPAPAPATVAPAASVRAAAAPPQGAPLYGNVNLDLVMDVELNVTLRFGKRQLSLREVLELASGSVVELDRQVDEPVELLLDGVVIARGEAVVVDGNYGLRVTEIAHPVSSSMLRGAAPAEMQAAGV
jgi:flagellar motor switch protein FliN